MPSDAIALAFVRELEAANRFESGERAWMLETIAGCAKRAALAKDELPPQESVDAQFLRDLSKRLLGLPPGFGVNGLDAERLNEIADTLDA